MESLRPRTVAAAWIGASKGGRAASSTPAVSLPQAAPIHLPPAPLPRYSLHRNARRNWTAENHLYNLLHRGFTSEPTGHAACPFDFYK